MKHPKHYDTDAATSKRMSNVKLKRGKEEIAFAKALWHRGYRYRLNWKQLPGSPDIAVQKYRIAIFIDGEFWHGYDWENKKKALKRNKDYWIEKIEENITRDNRVDKELLAMDWTPIHFWTKEINKNLEGCLIAIEEMIFNQAVNSEAEIE